MALVVETSVLKMLSNTAITILKMSTNVQIRNAKNIQETTHAFQLYHRLLVLYYKVNLTLRLLKYFEICTHNVLALKYACIKNNASKR